MTTDTLAPELAEKPAHVPDELVRDFDFHNIPGWEDDIQAAYARVQRENPDIFWTPRNGGHWVMTRASEIVQAQMDPSHYSYRNISLPPPPEGTPPSLPLELDPPIHGPYRRPLM